jgi:hypothetical protein
MRGSSGCIATADQISYQAIYVIFSMPHPRDGVDAALSPTASQCAKLVMLKSQGKREGIHEGN